MPQLFRCISQNETPDKSTSYILRIPRDELERQLFSQRTFYVGIKRAWTHGTWVLFIRKNVDMFIGSGIINRFVALDELRGDEKKLCLENNWYGKIVFAKLTRFYPAVPLHDTPAASYNPLVLHGSSMTGSGALQIERLAASRIIL